MLIAAKHHYSRSIPAYAGEPRGCSPLPANGQVYPRVCGGTAGMSDMGESARGLSPRMRGNLVCG